MENSLENYFQACNSNKIIFYSIMKNLITQRDEIIEEENEKQSFEKIKKNNNKKQKRKDKEKQNK